RERLLHEIVLQPLTRDEVYQLLRAMVAPARLVHSGLLDLVFAQSQGNPLFVEELAQSLVDSGASFDRDCPHGQQLIQALPVPRSLDEGVSRRTANISPAARSILDLAGAIGQHVDFALLHALAQLDEEALLAAIKELIAAQLLVEESAERYGFRHALTREAVYARLLQRERRALHRRIAAAIVELYADALDAHATDLAYHYAAGEEWEHTLVYAQRAGEQAQARYATYEALVQYTRVLQAVEKLGSPPPLPVLLACGRLANTLGDFEQAHRYLLTAQDQAVAAGAHQVKWQALIELGSLWMARDYGRSRAYLEQALDLARGLGDLAILARTLNGLGNWYNHQDQPAQALDHHQQALGIFEQLHDRHGEAETLKLLGLTSSVFADLVQGAACCERALDIFRQLDDRQGLLYSLTHRLLATASETDVPALSDPQVILSLGEEALRVAREMSYRDGEAQALSSIVQVLRPRGDYARALPLALRAVATYQEIDSHAGRARSQWCLGQLYLDLLALDAAQEQLEQALAAAHDGGVIMFERIATATLAATLVARGTPADLVRAETILSRALDEAPCVQTQYARACWAARAELALAQGCASSALRIVDSLVESTAHIAEHGLPGVPRLALLRGTALTALGRMEAAEAALQAAREGAVAQGYRALLWRIDAQLGRLYLATKRRPDAVRACAAACALVGELACGVPHEPLRASFQQRAQALIPLRPCATEREMEKQSFYGLTEREREVAALIARGKSNGEIAELLIMSKRTVEKHVANILGKLGATTRAQIVAWAIAMSLNQPLG
ncbi:MAG TPA: tetratricopeptide repeat protein, partial [Roseiflexaceae bacterium]